MKKTISLILTFAVVFCMMSVPCLGAETDFIVNTEVDVAENVVTIKGLVPEKGAARWATYYLLYPDKTPDDIPLDNADNPVVERNGQFRADNGGVFSETFKISGPEGIYTLYIRSGDTTKAVEIDTEYSDSKEFLWQLHMLGDTFPERTEADTKKLFDISRSELDLGYGDEIPVVEEFPTTGLYYVFVDPENGNDLTATGSVDKPFKTCNAALSEFKPEKGMVLTLRGGIYPVTDRIELSGITATEEAPFVITSYEDEEVIFTGGNVLNGGDFKKVTDTKILARLNPEISDNIRVLDMNDYGITEFRGIDTSYTPALWVDGAEYTIARWPNAGTTGMRECTDPDLIDTVGGTATKNNGVIDCGAVTVAVGSSCGSYRKYSKRATALNEAAGEIVSTDIGVEFCVEDIRPFSWVNTGDIWFYGSVYEEWRKFNFPISEFNAETRSIRTSWGNEWGAKYYPTHNKFYYFNVLEELDTPGEWFLDKETGLLYVYPTEDLSGKEIIYDAAAPSGAASYMLHLNKVQNVIINGITFKNSRGNGIYVGNQNSKHVIVQNCEFYNIRLAVYLAGRYSGVINSTFKDLVNRAVQLQLPSSEDNYKLIPARQFAMNNVLYNTTGIYSNGIGNVISHNFISNNKGSAIYPAGSETIAEYNEIVSGPRVTLDSGAIYTGGNAFKRGIHVRYNYIHDIGNISPRGIYFDDMLSGCYAYGNIVDGAWMQLHGARENAVYNNIFLNYQNGTRGAIRLDCNYYVSGTKTNIRWKTGNLEYGSMTAPIKPTSLYDQEIYKNRYPILKAWIPMMQERIAEYELTNDPYNSDIYSSENYSGYTDNNGKSYNLNEYLSASRDNYFGNNVLINTYDIVAGQDGKTAGYVNTGYENNILLTADENPFTDENFADSTAYDKIREIISGFETIPFEKMGLTINKHIQNEKTAAVKPAVSTQIGVPTDGLTLEWKYVMGAQRYKVEISDTSDFSTILESATTVECQYPVDMEPENDKIYYWRVTTIADATCVTGEDITSDIFVFKTAKASENGFNKVGITDYQLVDGNIYAYCYNLTEEEKQAAVYAAFYDGTGRFLGLKSEKITAPSNEFSEKITIAAPYSNGATVKLFVWSADGNMIPYTFVRTTE